MCAYTINLLVLHAEIRIVLQTVLIPLHPVL
jgi:hypothetical protein